jgi:hypothetical protein
MIPIPTNRTSYPAVRNAAGGISDPMDLTHHKSADAIRAPYLGVNDLINGRRRITPITALRLAGQPQRTGSWPCDQNQTYIRISGAGYDFAYPGWQRLAGVIVISSFVTLRDTVGEFISSQFAAGAWPLPPFWF